MLSLCILMVNSARKFILKQLFGGASTLFTFCNAPLKAVKLGFP